jgi:hypothetical protein
MLLQGHYQNAYVTRDLDASIATMRVLYGIQDWLTYTAEMEVTTPAGKGPSANKLAFGWVGGLQYELIQPLSGQVGFYTEALRDDGGMRFHHVCMRKDDLDAARREVERHKLPIVYEGQTGVTRFFYADARATLGHYLEFVQMADATWKQMGGR